MNRAVKVIAATIALTGGFWVSSYASPGDAQTYVSTSGSAEAAWNGPSSFLLAQHREDSIGVQGVGSRELKDAGVAFLYAAGPGFLVHGAGHFYAGKTKTGAVLLGSEVVGGALLFIGAFGKGVSQMEGGEPWEYGDILMVFGGILFLGSWAYDMIGAPLAVQKENRELLKRSNLHLEFDPDHTSRSVRIQIAKRF
jgi:hypothetical protein